MKVAIDVQHIGKRLKPADRGAAFDPDGPGPSREFTEVELVTRYAEAITNGLRAAGHEVFLSVASLTDGVLDGEYAERAAWANREGVDLYLACHLNAADPHGDYALIEFDYRAGHRTRDLVIGLAARWRGGLPVRKVLTKALLETDRGFGCISRVAAPALLLEPLFLNHPEHFAFLTSDAGPRLIGKAVVDAIAEWGAA
jgi:N-acetylmuramoyl-L-alanine amidase